jgi:hypothetical protein
MIRNQISYWPSVNIFGRDSFGLWVKSAPARVP